MTTLETKASADEQRLVRGFIEAPQDDHRGFKLVNASLQSLKNFQFTVGEIAHVDGPLIMCKNGLHFCFRAIDCYRYSGAIKLPYRYLQVVPTSAVHVDGDKAVALELLVERELTSKEWLAQVRKEHSTGEPPISACGNNFLLEIGAMEGDIELMRLILSAEHKLPLSPSRHKDNNRYLWAAAARGRVDSMEFLLRNGVTNSTGAISAAISGRHLNVVKFLLERGMPSILKESALLEAATTDSVEIVAALVIGGATNLNGAMETAATSDNVMMVEFLISCGATDFSRAAYAAGALSETAKYIDTITPPLPKGTPPSEETP